MSLIVVLLSIVLVLNAAFLILLILIQLPKKEAGAGLAFGAGATDALFGAGSGNALTKMTKYSSATFLGLVLALSILSQRVAHEGTSRIQSELKKRAASAPAVDAASANPPGTQVTTQGNQIIKITPVTTNSPIKVTPGPAPDAKATAPAPAPAKPAAPQPAAPAK